MSGNAFTAILLAAALLVAPVGPGHRLGRSDGRRVRSFALILGAAVVMALAVTAKPAVVLTCVIAAGTLAARKRRAAAAKRRRSEGEALAAALHILVGELTVGAHPMAAFSTAGAECGGPVGRALQAVATRSQLGADVGQGIRTVAAHSAVPAYWTRLAVFWQLAAEHGLAMSVLMRAAHRDIIDRQRFADRMHAELAGARATAVILAALPILGVLLGQMIGADSIAFLLRGGLGGGLLIMGVTLVCVGIAWADRIADRMVG